MVKDRSVPLTSSDKDNQLSLRNKKHQNKLYNLKFSDVIY